MSTRQTIKYDVHDHYGPEESGFHLFQECFDVDRAYVYLELMGAHCEVSTRERNVIVEIPRAWAVKMGLVEEG